MGIHHTSEIVPVSMSYACSRETRELGEDHHALRRVQLAAKIFERVLDRVLPKLQSERGKACVQGLIESFSDICFDASLGSTVLLARDAADEAHVRMIRRVVQRAHPEPIVEPDVCPLCGVDLHELNTSKNARDRGETSCERCESEHHGQFGAGA